MIGIDVRFLAGRFHATPWGRHVNEGEPEWPPSPWRLMRALVASWKRTAPELNEQQVQKVLTKLAAPPAFQLPPATSSHTRHYMPRSADKRLVHDPFVVIDRDRGGECEPLTFWWSDQELTEQEEQTLDKLLAGVGYFGRAESWCEAKRRHEKPEINSQPVAQGASDKESGTVHTLLCPEVDVTLSQLLTETTELQKKGYNRPPGSQWLAYSRPRTALIAGQKKPTPLTKPKHIAIFLLQARVLPNRIEALSVAEWIRMAANGAYGYQNEDAASPTFTGKLGGEIRQDQHRHAFFLPEGDPEGRKIDRVTIWAPDGFDTKELKVLKSLRSIPDHRRRGPSKHEDGDRIRLVPLALLDNQREGVFGHSTVWESYTPYLSTRYRDSQEEQIRRECRQRGLGELLSVEPIINKDWVTYRRRRWNKKNPPGTPMGYRLTFAEPIEGPLSLGGASHFGMGRFLPKND